MYFQAKKRFIFERNEEIEKEKSVLTIYLKLVGQEFDFLSYIGFLEQMYLFMISFSF